MKNIFLLLAFTVLFSACATQQSAIKSVLSDKEAVISLNSGTEIKTGDKLNLLKKTCVQKVRGGRLGVEKTVCSERLVGSAEVIRINSNQEAVVSKIGEFAFEPGLIVKKVD